MKLIMDMWKRYRYACVTVMAVCALLLTGCDGGDAARESGPAMSETSRPPITDASGAAISDARNTPAVRVAKSVGPAVVGITNKAVARDWFNHQFEVEQGVGSGVIFRSDGYIVTNNHVIANAREISVSLSDGRTVKGILVGADELTDIAVVKIDEKDLPTATFGNSDDILVGEPAIAIGNPMGLEFQGSVTVGVISALNRTLDISDRTLKLIQTDAAISPGNSGGALSNADGLVIGINSAKIAANGVEGMGFAIPINAVRDIVDQLMTNGRVIRPYLGVSVYDKATAARAGYALNVAAGVYVQKVALRGPADKVGIRPGDLIISIGGQATNTVSELRAAIITRKVGDKVPVEIEREGSRHTLEVTLEAVPEG